MLNQMVFPLGDIRFRYLGRFVDTHDLQSQVLCQVSKTSE